MEREQRFSCEECGFVFFQNVAAATACIISTSAGILFETRSKEPGKGKLALPGGFVNPGESTHEGVRRECVEELDWDPGDKLAFLCSFPNEYPYKGVLYHSCDLYFTVSAPNLSLSDLTIDPVECTGVEFIKKDKICLEDIAFESCRRALRFFINTLLAI